MKPLKSHLIFLLTLWTLSSSVFAQAVEQVSTLRELAYFMADAAESSDLNYQWRGVIPEFLNKVVSEPVPALSNLQQMVQFKGSRQLFPNPEKLKLAYGDWGARYSFKFQYTIGGEIWNQIAPAAAVGANLKLKLLREYRVLNFSHSRSSAKSFFRSYQLPWELGKKELTDLSEVFETPEGTVINVTDYIALDVGAMGLVGWAQGINAAGLGVRGKTGLYKLGSFTMVRESRHGLKVFVDHLKGFRTGLRIEAIAKVYLNFHRTLLDRTWDNSSLARRIYSFSREDKKDPASSMEFSRIMRGKKLEGASKHLVKVIDSSVSLVRSPRKNKLDENAQVNERDLENEDEDAVADKYFLVGAFRQKKGQLSSFSIQGSKSFAGKPVLDGLEDGLFEAQVTSSHIQKNWETIKNNSLSDLREGNLLRCRVRAIMPTLTLEQVNNLEIHGSGVRLKISGEGLSNLKKTPLQELETEINAHSESKRDIKKWVKVFSRKDEQSDQEFSKSLMTIFRSAKRPETYLLTLAKLVGNSDSWIDIFNKENSCTWGNQELKDNLGTFAENEIWTGKLISLLYRSDVRKNTPTSLHPMLESYQ